MRNFPVVTPSHQNFLRKQKSIQTIQKLGIHLRQRQAEVWRDTWLRGYCDLSRWLSVDQSEESLRHSPPPAQYGQNMLRLTETKKHSLVRDTAHRG